MHLVQMTMILINLALGLWHAWFFVQTLQTYGIDRLVAFDVAVFLAFTMLFFLIPALGWRLRHRASAAVVVAIISLPILLGAALGMFSLSLRSG
jgi:hypothetical protein